MSHWDMDFANVDLVTPWILYWLASLTLVVGGTLVVVGLWLAGAAAGAGLYYWWFQSLDKAMPIFAVLVFVVACIVGSLSLIHI